MKGGNLAEGVMYRSASPIDNQNNRAPYAADLAQKCGVQFILDLADTNEEIQGYYQNADYDITWHKSLYDAGNVAALNLNANYRGGQYAHRLAAGLREIIPHKAPILFTAPRARIVRALSAPFSRHFAAHPTTRCATTT